MSATVLCSGCGGRVAVPDDYTRARIRCPECGVMSDVPASAQKQAGGDKPRRPPSAVSDAAAEDILLGNDPAPPAEEKPGKRKRVQAIQAEPPRAPEPLHPLPPSPNEQATDEDDGRPYRVPGLDEERPCPECRTAIPREALLCTRCGYNLQTGKKAKQEFEPVDRQWQGGWPVKVRRGLFIAAEALFVTAAVVSVAAGADVCGVVFPWLLFSAMTAFLLGTYDHIHLTRNKKGRIRLTKTWTACFLPRPPQEVDVRDYGGVVYGPIDETSMMEWMILILLLLAFIIPGILWFYFVFFRTWFQVALSKEHGYPELILYRGSNEKMVLDVAETVRNVAHLPCSKN
ncbi:MAG TPA: hypothetical protein VKA46_28710 [Gemmataceae bacterium]|nr:hypothetical protein [Gemmataceae bacterium]